MNKHSRGKADRILALFLKLMHKHTDDETIPDRNIPYHKPGFV